MKHYFLLSFVSFSLVSQAAIHYVTQNGAGTFSGNNWNNAASSGSLQAVIDAANPGDEVWVACGTYLTSSGTDRNLSFRMKNNVQIYGGFNGTEILLSDRDLNCGPCSVLSANIGNPDLDDNAYHVIHNPAGIDLTAILDGFAIKDANDNRANTIDEGLGGGIYNHGGFSTSCSPTIRNCVISGNYASFGAGIFNSGHSGGNSSPLIENCIIADNHAYIGGGGIDNFGLGGIASPIMISCVVTHNTAVQRAGGMYSWGGNNGQANPQLTNCVFAMNTAVDGGGLVIDNEDSPPGNFSGSSDVNAVNSIFWYNAASSTGPEFFLIGSGSFTVSYSNIDLSAQQSPHELSGSGQMIYSLVPNFLDFSNPIGPDQCWLTDDDGLNITLASLMVNMALNSAAPQTDIRGRNRIENADIGAYELEYVTGLEESDKTNDLIYPNPAEELVTVEFQDGKEHFIEVYSIHGTLLSSVLASQNFVLDLNAHESGLYLLKIDHSSEQKIVKL